MKKFYGLILGAVIGFVVVACGGSSGGAVADSGLTETEVKALISDAIQPLQDRIAELEGQTEEGLTGNVLTASTATASAGMQKASAVSDICSVLSYAPSGTFPGSMESAACKSSTGYLLTLPITVESGTVRPTPLDNSSVYFTTTDCTGTPYITASQVGDMGHVQGAVFSIYETETASVRTVYTPPNFDYEVLNWASSLTLSDAGEWHCTAIGGTAVLHGFTPIANDPAVTGIEDTYTGPITMF